MYEILAYIRKLDISIILQGINFKLTQRYLTIEYYLRLKFHFSRKKLYHQFNDNKFTRHFSPFVSQVLFISLSFYFPVGFYVKVILFFESSRFSQALSRYNQASVSNFILVCFLGFC